MRRSPGGEYDVRMPERAAGPVTRRWSLDVLRIVSIVGVIAIHVFGNLVGNTEVKDSVRWWIAVAIDLGFVWVVPVFVMISGALVLEHRQFTNGPADFYRRRLLKLAPAFIFWPVFYAFVVHNAVTGSPESLRDFALGVIDGRSYTHLYFLWLIVGLYAAAPVLEAFLHGGGRRRAYVFAGVALAATVTTLVSAKILTAAGDERSLSTMALTQWVPYVGFFLAGWALRDLVLRGWCLAAVGFVTMMGTGLIVVQYGLRGNIMIADVLLPVSYYGPVVAVVALGCFITVNSILARWQPGPATGLFRTLSDAAFGVFLVHFAVMLAVRSVPAFNDSDESLVSAFAIWALVTVVSFAVVIVLRKIPFARRLV